MQIKRKVEAESPHPFKPWVSALERHWDPKGLDTQPLPMISKRLQLRGES